MFIPIGDEPNPTETPWATWGLMAANVAIWLLICRPALSLGVDVRTPEVQQYLHAMQQLHGQPLSAILAETTQYDLLTFRYGFRPGTPSAIACLTSLFLHAGWMHLGGNMLFLWIFGDNVEARVGPRRFVVLYLACGVLATLFYAAFRGDSGMPLIGASGAISGILGVYFIWFPHNRVRVLWVLIFITVLRIPARIVLGIYLVLENILPYLAQSPGAGGTAYGAHIGGFFAGSAFALGWAHLEATGQLGTPMAWLHTQRQQRAAGPRTGSPPRGPISSGHGVQDVEADIAAGRFGAAQAGWARLPADARRLLGAESFFALADHITAEGEYAAAQGLLQRFIADRPHAPAQTQARAHLRVGLLQLRGSGRPAAAREHLLAVLDLLPTGPEVDAARAALADC